MSHNLFPQLVSLNEETHQYTDASGNIYMGFSKFADEFLTRPFNKSGAAYGVAKSAINKGEMMTADSVIEKWNEQRELGVRVDKAITLYLKDKLILESDLDIAALIMSVCAEYKEFKTVISQGVVYNTQFKVGGSPDAFMLTSNRPDASFIMSDFKVFEKESDLFEHKAYFFPPIGHLSYTKVSKISLQLSFYAFQLEQLIGKRCKKLFIHLINPVTQTHQQIVVPYLKNDILLLLEHNKEKILEYSKPKIESIF